VKKAASSVKRQQRQALFLKEVVRMFHEILQDEPSLSDVYPVKVELSKGDGMCYVYFSAPEEEIFDAALETLKLYKPSLRKALAKIRQSRHTPNVTFVYDKSLERSRRVNELIDQDLAKIPS